MARPRNPLPAEVTKRILDVLEEFHTWAIGEHIKAVHGPVAEDAGRAIAFAQVMQHIRALQGVVR